MVLQVDAPPRLVRVGHRALVDLAQSGWYVVEGPAINELHVGIVQFTETPNASGEGPHVMIDLLPHVSTDVIAQEKRAYRYTGPFWDLLSALRERARRRASYLAQPTSLSVQQTVDGLEAGGDTPAFAWTSSSDWNVYHEADCWAALLIGSAKRCTGPTPPPGWTKHACRTVPSEQGDRIESS
jgi:hypothetical protein